MKGIESAMVLRGRTVWTLPRQVSPMKGAAKKRKRDAAPPKSSAQPTQRRIAPLTLPLGLAASSATSRVDARLMPDAAKVTVKE